MRALQRKLWRDAWHARGQLLAIGAVVVSGIALFVSMRSMHGHLRRSRDAWYHASRFPDLFASVPRAPVATLRTLATLPGIAAVEGRVVLDVPLRLPGRSGAATGRLVSIPVPRAPGLAMVSVATGRWPDRARHGEVLVSRAFAAANALEAGDSLRATIAGRSRWLRIVGTGISPEFVYEVGSASLFPDSRGFGVLWMPHHDLAAAAGLEGAFNDVVALLHPGTQPSAVMADVDRVLARYGSRGAYGRSQQVSDQFVTGEIDETQVTSILLPGIFLGVGAFLIYIVLARFVATQRDQVATLKAFGYTPAAIGRHVVGLSLIPLLAGVVAGTGLGAWLAVAFARIYERFFQFPAAAVTLEPAILLQGAVSFVLLGVAGAWLAARRATSLPPAVAMQPEAPARYRPGLIAHLWWRPTPVTAMVIRQLERHPWKSLLSVVGLGVSGGLVVTSLAMFDTIDYMRTLLAFEGDRGDLTVTWAAPVRPADGRHATRHPGVLAVEGFRSVPVRLRGPAGSWRTAILAVPFPAALRRVVDLEGQAFVAGGGGLLLAEPLADSLGIRAGDTVSVEVLEGNWRRTVAPVVGVFADVMGMAAYMDLADTPSLTGGEVTWSGTWLRVDSRALDSVTAALRDVPGVAGVADRAAMLEGFDRTIAESFTISLAFTVGFATIIALAIVYNTGRIALSERARELASLRILGFTHREVATMLIGEQALLTLAAVPAAGGVATLLVWLIAVRFESTLFRLPMVVTARSHLLGTLVLVVSGVLSALFLLRRLRAFDLVQVLKTRE